MSSIELSEGITWEISIIGLALTLFTLTNMITQSYQHKTDWLVIGWLVLLNIPFVHSLFGHLNIDASTFQRLTNPTLNLLHGPILYLYARMLISEQVTLRGSDLWHLVPFFICNLLFLSMTHPLPMIPAPDTASTGIGPVAEGGLSHYFAPIMANFGLINVLAFVAYSMLTISSLRAHQQRIVGIFSQDDNHISLKWIYSLPAMFAFITLLNLANENLLPTLHIIKPQILHLSCFLGFVFLLALFGVKQKPVFYFKGNRQPFDIEPIKAKSAPKDELPHTIGVTQAASVEASAVASLDICPTDLSDNSNMSDESILNVIDEMNAYMITKKPYLDCDFSVYALAQALDVPRRTLSMVLSSGLSKNFYQYVNEFRIEEVKNRLKAPTEKHTTIIDIAFQSGFNSKSSFNSLFKQHCGVTPSQYRKTVTQAPIEAKDARLN
jgi:AraC-like DNA-binding protein